MAAIDRSIMALDGQVAIVTGGAQGIGRAISLGLAAFGADVAIADKNLSGSAAVVKEIESLCGTALAVSCNVSHRSEVQAMVDRVRSEFGRIDILVNNAGVLMRCPAEEVDDAHWEMLMAVNLRGLFYCCQAVGAVMREQGGGKIINVTSIVAERGFPRALAVYSASKGGVSALTRALAVEWAPHKIRVNAVQPSHVETALIQDVLQNPEVRERIVARIPLGRVAEPEDVVGAVVFLASEASRMVTGQIIAVDGGYSIA